MKVIIFANKMPDLCGAFLHDVDLAIELQKRGHMVVFLTITRPTEGYNGGVYRGFRFMHYSAASSFLDSSDIWICPHSPCLPDVRKLNARGYDRPIIATCHYDGNYKVISANSKTSWSEMLLFINGIMEPNYRNNVVPWPSQIVKTDVVRPILHREKIVIDGPFSGNCITLVNANQNKGVNQFVAIAKAMPNRKFLAVLPYYGERRVPLGSPNIEWIPFDDDIRNVLKRTRILLVPSFAESFGRIAVEAMINGIPVIYTKAVHASWPTIGTEGMEDWIAPTGIACNRDNVEEWTRAIETLDDAETYSKVSEESKDHVERMNLFTEASRIAQMVETFSREHPVVIKTAAQQASQDSARPSESGRLVQPGLGRPAGVGFSSGRLRIQR